MTDNNLNDAVKTLLEKCSNECITSIVPSIKDGKLTLRIITRGGTVTETELDLSPIVPTLTVEKIASGEDPRWELDADGNKWDFKLYMPETTTATTATWDNDKQLLIVTTDKWNTGD